MDSDPPNEIGRILDYKVCEGGVARRGCAQRSPTAPLSDS